MEDRQTIRVALCVGETRQLLLEAGSTVLVLSGQLLWNEPPAWVAETMIAGTQVLGAEEARVVERSGWVEFGARSPVQAVVIAPQGIAFWSQVGQCLSRMFGNSGESKALR